MPQAYLGGRGNFFMRYLRTQGVRDIPDRLVDVQKKCLCPKKYSPLGSKRKKTELRMRIQIQVFLECRIHQVRIRIQIQKTNYIMYLIEGSSLSVFLCIFPVSGLSSSSFSSAARFLSKNNTSIINVFKKI